MKPATVAMIVLLGAVAFGHVVRLASGIPITVADRFIPMWVSWVGFVVAGGLAIALWRSDRGHS